MKAVILVCLFAIVAIASANNIGGETSSQCLTGAGYTWCAFENKCVRPWELAKEKGLEMSASNIESYCNVKRIGGSSADSNGCVTTAGYSWCAKQNKCVRPWELARTQQITISTVADFNNYCGNNNSTKQEVGNDKDSHSCVASEGYSWCKKENKCVQSWELMKSLGLESTPISFESYCSDCLASAGYSYCYAEQKCVRPWELAKQLAIAATPESIRAYCTQEPATKQVVHITGPLLPTPGLAQNQVESSEQTIGGAAGTHNCIAGAGYTWCQTEGKCVRPWELAREKGMVGMTAESFASYCQ